MYINYNNNIDKNIKNIYNYLVGEDVFRRCNMKRTYQPNNHRRSKKMGFLARIKSGVVARRRRKGRKVLSR